MAGLAGPVDRVLVANSADVEEDEQHLPSWAKSDFDFQLHGGPHDASGSSSGSSVGYCSSRSSAEDDDDDQALVVGIEELPTCPIPGAEEEAELCPIDPSPSPSIEGAVHSSQSPARYSRSTFQRAPSLSRTTPDGSTQLVLDEGSFVSLDDGQTTPERRVSFPEEDASDLKRLLRRAKRRHRTEGSTQSGDSSGGEGSSSSIRSHHRHSSLTHYKRREAWHTYLVRTLAIGFFDAGSQFHHHERGFSEEYFRQRYHCSQCRAASSELWEQLSSVRDRHQQPSGASRSDIFQEPDENVVEFLRSLAISDDLSVCSTTPMEFVRRALGTLTDFEHRFSSERAMRLAVPLYFDPDVTRRHDALVVWEKVTSNLKSVTNQLNTVYGIPSFCEASRSSLWATNPGPHDTPADLGTADHHAFEQSLTSLVDGQLKRTGFHHMMALVAACVRPALAQAAETLNPASYIDLRPTFLEMNLPEYIQLYIYVAWAPLKIVEAAVRNILKRVPATCPSPLSIEFYVTETKEALEIMSTAQAAFQDAFDLVQYADKFSDNSDATAFWNWIGLMLDESKECIEELMRAYLTLNQYRTRGPDGSVTIAADLMANEWRFMQRLWARLRMPQSAQTSHYFCSLAGMQLKLVNDTLQRHIDGITAATTKPSTGQYRTWRQAFRETNKHITKALGFAKSLVFDLEFCCSYRLELPVQNFVPHLVAQEYVLVARLGPGGILLPIIADALVLAPMSLLSSTSSMQLIRDILFSPVGASTDTASDRFLLVLNLNSTVEPGDPCAQEPVPADQDCDSCVLIDGAEEADRATANVALWAEERLDLLATAARRQQESRLVDQLKSKDDFQCTPRAMLCDPTDLGSAWPGQVLCCEFLDQVADVLDTCQAGDLCLLAENSASLTKCRAKLSADFKPYTTSIRESNTWKKSIATSVNSMKRKAEQAVRTVQSATETIPNSLLTHESVSDRELVLARDVVQACFHMEFNYLRSSISLLTGPFEKDLIQRLVKASCAWCAFVMEHYGAHRGTPPSWAKQGLAFIAFVTRPGIMHRLTRDEFVGLQTVVEQCVSHLTKGENGGQRSNLDVDSGTVSPTPPSPKVRSTIWDNHYRINPSDMFTPAQSRRAREFRLGSGSRSGMSSLDSSYRTLPDIDELLATGWYLSAFSLTQDDRRPLVGRVLTDSESTTYRDSDTSQDDDSISMVWQIGKLIGTGAGGEVFSGLNINTREIMAVKRVKLPLTPHERAKLVGDVKKEYQILARLSNPHLVKYLGLEVHREHFLLFMEYCSNGSLWAQLSSPLPEPIIQKNTLQLLLGLQYLHRQGVIHRDLKGDNVLLSSSMVIKIADFGSCIKLTNNLKTAPGEANELVGTVPYMAPEVIKCQNKEGHGRAADIWSLGCVVVEMATAQRPYAERFDTTKSSAHQLIFLIGSGRLSRPGTPGNLGPEGLKFLDACFQANPKDRPDSSELLESAFVKPWLAPHLPRPKALGSAFESCRCGCQSKQTIL